MFDGEKKRIHGTTFEYCYIRASPVATKLTENIQDEAAEACVTVF
jgi:hypothetical protein